MRVPIQSLVRLQTPTVPNSVTEADADFEIEFLVTGLLPVSDFDLIALEYWLDGHQVFDTVALSHRQGMNKLIVYVELTASRLGIGACTSGLTLPITQEPILWDGDAIVGVR